MSGLTGDPWRTSAFKRQESTDAYTSHLNGHHSTSARTNEADDQEPTDEEPAWEQSEESEHVRVSVCEGFEGNWLGKHQVYLVASDVSSHASSLLELSADTAHRDETLL